jgi:hypothetical protein
MTFLLVPHEVSATTATVWVGALDEPFAAANAAFVLRSALGDQPLGAWATWGRPPGPTRVWFQRVTLPGLQPRTRHTLELLVDGAPRAAAAVTTLPATLPAADEKPFTLLLGSCFCAPQDQAGTVGNAYFHLPAGARPDIKILCGDQVYADAPWSHYLRHTHSADELADELFGKYREVWTQGGDGTGFRELLREGANYFGSDDHELWNNAPDFGVYVRDTWSQDGRDRWMEIARGLYDAFQAARPRERFDVGELSFFVVDARLNRTPDRARLMDDADFAALEAWIAGLTGPGVLVVGQPILTESAGFFGRFSDWSLADYGQYAPLVRRLLDAQHSIVVLTGDMHYGRVASCSPRPGVEIIEVMSSPMALVDPLARATWAPAPPLFPAFELPGTVQHPVASVAFSRNDNHFQTIEFFADGAFVRMRVRFWPVEGLGQPPSPLTVFERWLA